MDVYSIVFNIFMIVNRIPYIYIFLIGGIVSYATSPSLDRDITYDGKFNLY